MRYLLGFSLASLFWLVVFNPAQWQYSGWIFLPITINVAIALFWEFYGSDTR